MQVLGALASVMTVWLVTGILLFEAVQRIITPEVRLWAGSGLTSALLTVLCRCSARATTAWLSAA